MRRRRHALAFIPALIIAGCLAPDVPPRPAPPVACTLIGCESQMTFELDADLARGETYEIEACVGGECASETVSVPGSGFAVAGPFTVDPDRDSVTVRLVRDDYSGRHDVSISVIDLAQQEIVRLADTVEFERVQPNGEGCEPVCWQVIVRA